MFALNEAVTALRPRMLSVARRVLPNIADAEDAVQDAFLQSLHTQDVRCLEGFLIRTTVRRCIDRLRKKRLQDRHVNSWTILRSNATASRLRSVPEESLCQAFRYMLERLTRHELAAFILRTVFEFDYAEIAGFLNKAEDNVRQVFHRARSRLLHGNARFEPDPKDAAKLAEQFSGACRTGEVTFLVRMMLPCVEGVVGPHLSQARNHGWPRCARARNLRGMNASLGRGALQQTSRAPGEQPTNAPLATRGCERDPSTRCASESLEAFAGSTAPAIFACGNQDLSEHL